MESSGNILSLQGISMGGPERLISVEISQEMAASASGDWGAFAAAWSQGLAERKLVSVFRIVTLARDWRSGRSRKRAILSST